MGLAWIEVLALGIYIELSESLKLARPTIYRSITVRISSSFGSMRHMYGMYISRNLIAYILVLL